jgi:protein-disulfide isomerase
MKRSLIALTLSSLIVSPTYATSSEDVLLERLEASGKLDAAIDRAIERRIAREKQQHEVEAKTQETARQEAAKKIQPLGTTDRIYGPEHAKVSIIVMSDPECPYCQRFAGTPEKAVDQSNGLANAAVRLFPLDFHGQPAVDASVTALCVADQAGAKGYYAFFNGYLTATQGNGRGIPDAKGKPAKAVMDKLLKSAGVPDIAKLKTCQQDKTTMKRLEAEFNTSVEAGATGTPYVVLRNNENGAVKILPGAIPVEMLLDEVRTLGGPSAAAPK